MAIDSHARLGELENALRAIAQRKLATQTNLVTAASVDQSKISSAPNGNLKVWNQSTERLMTIIGALEGTCTSDRSASVSAEMHSIYANGGTEADFIATIAHAAALVGRHLERKTSSNAAASDELRQASNLRRSCRHA